jgi:hypothetical protein
MDTLRNYTFLPWTRQGFASEIATDDNLGTGGSAPGAERAAVPVSFTIAGQPISKQVQLLGPGDVIGINPRVVVKTDPRHWVTDFESNYLPYIEFYEEDFPWRFTPARAGDALVDSRLRPWICLVVLEEGEFVERRAGRPLAAFEINDDFDPASFFPPPDQSWAWAHVHVSQNIIGSTLQTTDEAEVRAVEQNFAQTLRNNADSASSRLLCARKLKDNTAYHAFVVPAFETGRRAGLGETIPPNTSGQQASWGDGQRVYPIYFRWFFRTGAKGDFEFLVDLLEPRFVDKQVGVRAMDMQNPGYEVEGMSGPLRVMGLEGALKSPDTESSPVAWPPEGTDFNNPPPGSAGRFLNQLEAKVNLQFTLQQEESADNPHPDPIVSPPLYGKWYALAERLEKQGSGWVNDLNRDPRLRVPAGAGTQVIQKDQEKFMQQAWAQLGDLLQANQKIRQLQLAWMSAFVTYQKNVIPQPVDQLLTFTHAVQPRVLGSPTTIAKQVKESRLPQAAIDPAFRKIARSRGAVMRKVVPAGTARPAAVLARLNEGTLTAAPPPPDPTGQISLDGVAKSIVPPSPAEWLRDLLRNRVFAIALVALAVVLLLLIVTGTIVWLLVGIVIAVALAVVVARQVRRVNETVDALQEKSFTPAAIDRIPSRSNFVLTEFQQPLPSASATPGGDSVEAASFRVAVKDAFNAYQSPPTPLPIPQPLALEHAVGTLTTALNPAVAIPRRAEFMLKIPASIKGAYLRPQKTIVPVMAHPVFTEPMYRALRDISPEFLAPNLELIPNNTISLLETNQRFIEAYMVGLNDEMGRELLWREFPTDQRGSYFRQFWDVGDSVNRDPNKPPAQVEEELLDITRLHTWNQEGVLGEHASRPLPSGAEPGEARLVLVIRGDLLKKYPTAVIYAQQGRWNSEGDRVVRVLDDTNPAQFIKPPVFKAEIEPDVRFLGFDLTASVVKGNPDPAANNPGWFFVIQERPGEPRFGLDNLSEESPETPTTWNELAWEHLADFASLDRVDFDVNVPDDTSITSTPDSQFEWGRNAADMAYILYQVPVMVAFHAADMLS